MSQSVIIGSGPAGLMAAEVLAQAGAQVIICDAKPSFGRKFLMAGKSGLNLTKDAPQKDFNAAYDDTRMAQITAGYGAQAVQDWATGLDQELFTGTTGRIFPKAMKASPLLRAWLARLDSLGVERRTRWRWTGWVGDALQFDTPDGVQSLTPDTTILALGGASWARLGSDGAWVEHLRDIGVPLDPFAPSNAGVTVAWSDYMKPHFGSALKGVAWHAGDHISRGEGLVSASGLEGGGLYNVTRALREGATLHVDLMPDLSADQITAKLSKPRGKMSLSNHLRKALKLTPAQQAVLNEFVRPLPQGLNTLAHAIKHVPIAHTGFAPIDQAISTAGGVAWDALDEALMLKAKPNTFCAGEMIAWDAPTGGYLITGCLATGRRAGLSAAKAMGL